MCNGLSLTRFTFLRCEYLANIYCPLVGPIGKQAGTRSALYLSPESKHNFQSILLCLTSFILIGINAMNICKLVTYLSLNSKDKRFNENKVICGENFLSLSAKTAKPAQDPTTDNGIMLGSHWSFPVFCFSLYPRAAVSYHGPGGQSWN